MYKHFAAFPNMRQCTQSYSSFHVPSSHTGSGTIVRCVDAGVGMFFLEQMCHWPWVFRYQMIQPDSMSLLWSVKNPDVEISAPVSACMLPCFPE